MIKNRALNKKMRSKSKNAQKNGLFLKDRIQEINGYQNMVDNKKSIINTKISEEEKNIENSLFKLNNKFNNITARHLRNENQQFLENFKKFSKTNSLKLDSLFQDLSQIYYNKGYKMPNINKNLYKVNPLLENNPQKIFLSNLSSLIRSKSNKPKKLNLTSSKAIKYMNKLEKIITPENEEKKLKVMPPNLMQRKLIKKRIKIKEKIKKQNKILTNSIKNLIKMINNNDLNNLDENSYSKIRNKSEIIKKKDNNIYYNKLYNTNIITDIKTKINKKEKNGYNNLKNCYESDSSINKINLKNNMIKNYNLDINNNNESDLSYRKNNKTYYSTQKYTIPKINRIIIIKKKIYILIQKEMKEKTKNIF